MRKGAGKLGCSPFHGVHMFRSRSLALAAIAAILALTACTDITAPSPEFCPIGGGPGTCPGVSPK